MQKLNQPKQTLKLRTQRLIIGLLCAGLLSPTATSSIYAYSQKAPEIPDEPTPDEPVPDQDPSEEEEPVYAGPCADVIKAADSALLQCSNQVKARDVVISAQDVAITTLMRQRQEALDQIDVRGSTPWYMWVLVGAASALVIDNIRR